MPRKEDGRRSVELPIDLYSRLERQAHSLHVSNTALATMLLATALQEAEARSKVPFYAQSRPQPDRPDLCLHDWPDSDEASKTCAKCGLTVYRVG